MKRALLLMSIVTVIAFLVVPIAPHRAEARTGAIDLPSSTRCSEQGVTRVVLWEESPWSDAHTEILGPIGSQVNDDFTAPVRPDFGPLRLTELPGTVGKTTAAMDQVPSFAVGEQALAASEGTPGPHPVVVARKQGKVTLKQDREPHRMLDSTSSDGLRKGCPRDSAPGSAGPDPAWVQTSLMIHTGDQATENTAAKARRPSLNLGLQKVPAAKGHRPGDKGNAALNAPRLEAAEGRGGRDSGNCCIDHCAQGPGCEDPVCELFVCLDDPFCCNVCWDQTCADRAQAEPYCDCPICTPDYSVTAPYTSPSRNTCGAGDHCGLRPSEDHIYEVTIPSDDDWRFSLCTSSWDTYLYLGTTCCGSQVGSDDDGCGVLYGPSELVASLTAGTYYVTIEGWAGTDCGPYALEISPAGCEYTIPADSTCDTSVNIDFCDFCFLQNPGYVSFSVSPPCGFVDPPGMWPPGGPPYCVSTDYHPCETEGLTVTVTADPSVGSVPEETATVYLEPREDIGCEQQQFLCVGTFDEDGNPVQAYVCVSVCEPEGCGGSVDPVCGWSQYDPPSGWYIFCSTYDPDPCVGRVSLKFWLPDYPGSKVYFSFDQTCCADCEPADADLDPIGTIPCGDSVTGDCGSGGKWVGRFDGQQGATYHFDLCPDSPCSGTNSGFDPDIKIADSSCTILAGQDGSCSSPLYSPNDFQWICPADGTYYVIVAPWPSYASHTCDGTASDTFTMRYYSVGEITVELGLDSNWMYQSLPGQLNCDLTATLVSIDDPLNNSSYTYLWEFVLPPDVSEPPVILDGGGGGDTMCRFAAPSCDADGLSDVGAPHKVRLTVTGNDYGNTGTAEVEFGVCLLGDVNTDGVVNVADRSIINACWRTGSAGSYTLRECDVNCDGVVNVADRSIANAIWRGALCSNSVGTPCPLCGTESASVGLSARDEQQEPPHADGAQD